MNTGENDHCYCEYQNHSDNQLDGEKSKSVHIYGSPQQFQHTLMTAVAIGQLRGRGSPVRRVFGYFSPEGYVTAGELPHQGRKEDFSECIRRVVSIRGSFAKAPRGFLSPKASNERSLL
jgi:hypothetical protein